MAALAALKDDSESEHHPTDELLAKARAKLIIALDDFNTVGEAREFVRELGEEAEFYKVGLRLQLKGGDAFAQELKRDQKKVFLDYKYHDIGNTVEHAVRQAANLGIDFLTVHGTSQILAAAVRGRGDSNLKLLIVTVLTNMDTKDLEEMGYPEKTIVKDIVLHRAKKALEAGIDGVIAAGEEAEAIKGITDNRLMVVSPGIRADGSPVDDQKRVMTPRDAIQSGADYLVVGRPILNAASPKHEARKYVAQIAEALQEKGS
jgi:orotidine-5'-phosphate decarboxylase